MGRDETFGIANLLKMFQALVQEVKDAESNEDDMDKDEPTIAASAEPQQTMSILDSLIWKRASSIQVHYYGS